MNDAQVTVANPSQEGRSRLAPFFILLTVFYVAWFSLVSATGQWSTVRDHWGIALAMLLGSYVAGSTPMGGGSVGFPVLVLLFDLPGSLGRNFGLAIQSIGMVSAGIFIICQRRPLCTSIIRPTMLGAAVGTPLGAALIAPAISDLAIKITFAVVWCSFGLMHLAKLKELIAHEGVRELSSRTNWISGLVVGLCGGVVASITGVGIDMLAYAVLVLMYQADLKRAIPTSVILMAFTSLIGISSNWVLSELSPSNFAIEKEVYLSWLAAAPVVAIGAPFGAFAVNLLPRQPTLIFVSLLCITQFFWTAIHEHLSWPALAASIVAIGLVNGLFIWLYHLGIPADHAQAGTRI